MVGDGDEEGVQVQEDAAGVEVPSQAGGAGSQLSSVLRQLPRQPCPCSRACDSAWPQSAWMRAHTGMAAYRR